MNNKKTLYKIFQEIFNSKKIEDTEIVAILKDTVKKFIEKEIDPDVDIDLVIDLTNNDWKFINKNYKIISDEDYKELLEEEKISFTTISIANSKNIKKITDDGEERSLKIDDVITMECDIKDFIPKDKLKIIHQSLIQKVNEISRQKIFLKYSQLKGSVVKAKFISHNKAGKNYELVDENISAFMPKYLSSNKTYDINSINNEEDVYIYDVHEISKRSQIIISDISNKILFEILNKEIPEIVVGKVKIENISRRANEKRAKIAISSLEENGTENVLGSLIGIDGNRIENISNYLDNEKIDIVLFSKNKEKFIINSLAPSKVISIISEKDKKNKYKVVVPNSQHTLAIGKKGINVILAGELVNSKLDIISYSQAINEFGENNIIWNGNIKDKEELEQLENSIKTKAEFNNKNNNNYKNRSNKAFASFLMEEFDKEIEQFNEDFKFNSDFSYGFDDNELNLDDPEMDELEQVEEQINENETDSLEVKKENFTEDDINQIKKEIKNYKYDNDLNEFAGVKEIDIKWDDDEWGEE
ncbi:NusA N-terminal domain-containing protein [[Mycoplasma] collis]|uniref:NusA N-terminal domain-containing protein n=1 Tax=[Mycoplasma] collis TaxID=2127 RepID=UPI00051B5244|nr:NusA N-terminal domain-containing protein [[Mycoplasma] collis]